MTLSAWRYYLTLYQGSHKSLFLSAIVSIGQSFLIVPIAFLIRYAFDNSLPNGDFDFLMIIGGIIFLIYLTESAIKLWIRYVTLKVTKTAIRKFREALLIKLYDFSIDYYNHIETSELHSNIVFDTHRVDMMSNALVTQLLPALIISVVLSVVLVFFNWFLFVIMLSIAPLIFLVDKTMRKKLKARVKENRRCRNAFSQGILFVLQMMELTRLQSAEQFEIKRQNLTIDNLSLKSSASAWMNTAYSSVQNTIMISSGVLILIVGGNAVIVGTMSLGEFLSFYVVVNILKNQIKTLLSVIPLIIEGNKSLITLYSLLNIHHPQPYSGQSKITFNGKIVLKNIEFQYQENCLVLQDINLTIHPHTTVAIIGSNGSGKSTILQLILGFYLPQQGKIYADDKPFDELDLVHLRRSMGVVMQDSVIFSGTVFDNISYGDSEITLQQVIVAAELATAHEFIQKLPNGYETLVGDKGMLLSGGQRQRIAIARALVRCPKLLILDEPTNHLDTEAVNQLIHNLKNLEAVPTIIIISHDMTIVREAQFIYLLQDRCLLAYNNPKIVLGINDISLPKFSV